MRPAVTLSAFAALLAGSLAGGAALGRAIGPDVEPPAAVVDAAHGASGTSGGHGGEADGPGAPVASGTSVAAGGVRLAAAQTVLPAAPSTFEFSLLDEHGDPVDDLRVQHERLVHLIVASQDLSSYLHLHPTEVGAGRWQVDLPALAPGAHRAIVDIARGDDDPVALGVDLLVPGAVDPQPLQAPTSTAAVGDTDVGLATGEVEAGEPVTVSFSVERAGRPVPLRPYLGARGHLVALRDGDLAYLHVHPAGDRRTEDADGSQGIARFEVSFPSAGSYRLFFDHDVDGEVRTAAFTVEVPAEVSR